jgi:CRISPR/Cas system-associated exonuclease Cas4 (RecB family)
VKIGISPDEMGSLEHSIIEEYFTENEYYESESLKNKCSAKLIEHVKNRNSIISYKEQQEVLFELVEYTFNGLDFLYQLKKNRPNAKINFEHSINENQWNLKGYIDVLIEENNNLEIYDFKRSSASVGSKKALESYEKLQLWIYSLAMNSSLKPVSKMGYVNISEIDKKTEMNLTQADLDTFSDYLNKLITRFEGDEEYFANPRKDDVCNYCPIRKICSKGVN